MSGYWTKAIEKIFKAADSIDEDWSRRTVHFEVTNFDEQGFIFELETIEKLAALLGTRKIVFKVKGDNRYADENSAGVVLTVRCLDVNFPAPKEA